MKKQIAIAAAIAASFALWAAVWPQNTVGKETLAPTRTTAVTPLDADFRTPKIGDKCSRRFNMRSLAAATRKNAPHRQGLPPAENRCLIYCTKNALI